MLSIGQSAAAQKQYEALLCSPHRVYSRLSILTLNHVYLQDISSKLLDGSVNVDVDGDPCTRNLNADFLDPTSSMRLDSNDPNDSALFMDRMVKAYLTIINPLGTLAFDVPIFCGPISKVQRSDVTVTMEGQGKESLSPPTIWTATTFAKGLQKSTVIKRIIRDILGETKFDIPDYSDKLSSNLSITIDDSPWLVAKKLARSMGCQLFYDGRGVCVMRRIPTKSVFRFDDARFVLTQPEIDYDVSEVYNCVHVIGAKPKGAKERIKFKLVADRSHPLSPWKIGRTNAPRYIPKVIQDDSIETMGDAKALAKKELAIGLITAMNTSFDSLPVPHLDPGDLAQVDTGNYLTTFSMKQFTIPLLVTSPSTIGYLKRTKPNKKHIRRNKL